MPEENNNYKPSLWKKFEKVSGVIVLLSAIAVIIGLYFQVHSKKTEVAFQIISKDYLTNNNNIDRLKSNYEYAGIPVKHLWLLKFKIINTGDVTLIGKGLNSSLLDSALVFKFPSNVQILNQPSLINNNLPDHQLSRIDSNSISLSFQQWREGEFILYSIYVKSDKSVSSFIPTSKRMVKDGNISIQDLSNGQTKTKIPLLDILFTSPWTLIFRGLGIILGLFISGFITYGMFWELKAWIKILKWKSQYYKIYENYLTSNTFLTDNSNFTSSFTKDDFIKNKKTYLQKPMKLEYNVNIWQKIGIPAIKSDAGFFTTWKNCFLFTLVFITIFAGGIFIILGLILH